MDKKDKLKDECSLFIRKCLPDIRDVSSTISTIPRFFAKADRLKNGRHKIIETAPPNWFQLPKELKDLLYKTPDTQQLAKQFEKTSPFTKILNKEITIPALGQSATYTSGMDIANTILVSYLFSAGCGKWNRKKFDKVWNDFQTYFDPASKTIEYFLYAPIVNMAGGFKKIDLGDGVLIRRLTENQVANLASLNSNLAGYSVYHRTTRWTTCFFEKRMELEKIIEKDNTPIVESGNRYNWESSLNEEVSLLRCLLNESISVTTFSFIRDGFPRDGGGGVFVSLPWRARFPDGFKNIGIKEVRCFKKMRSKFLDLHGDPGWENVAISMRRYAVAWENPFMSDILADIVAALEQLVVDSKSEVSYKLRTRVAYFLGKSDAEKITISKNLNDAYGYRSNVFHGGYVFDNPIELEGARRMKRAKGKKGNPFHEANEVNRLIGSVSGYYRDILKNMIDQSKCKISWEEIAL